MTSNSHTTGAARLLFAGTPEFANASLQALLAAGHVPLAVLTQPDRPAGRGKKLAASPVKSCALANNIDVWQPATLKRADVVARIAALEPDAIIVAAYGLILPQTVLDIPRQGCINVHASLLPRWRGAAPIQMAIASGDRQSGISLMRMERGLDTGPVFATAATAIGAAETGGELHDRLAVMGGELLVQKLGDILSGKLAAVPQDDSLATYAGKLDKCDAAIDWQESAAQIERKIRAFNPLPGAWFEYKGENIRCWKAALAGDANGAPGVVQQAGKAGIDVNCGTGMLRLLEVQRPGRRPVSAAEFAAQLPLVGRQFCCLPMNDRL